MPLDEVIGELSLRPFLEIVICGLAYWTGFLLLKLLSFGSLRLAPFMTFQEKNRNKQKWHQIDWSIWLHKPMQKKMLKAEATILTGILCWITIGFSIYMHQQN